MESLGIRLKKLRKDKGLTQVELGKLSGAYSYFCLYRCGNARAA